MRQIYPEVMPWRLDNVMDGIFSALGYRVKACKVRKMYLLDGKPADVFTLIREAEKAGAKLEKTRHLNERMRDDA